MRKRIKEIDVLYAVGVILVILGHSHSSDWSTFEGTILHSLISFIYVFHMPLFFFIAGFLFENSKGIEKQGYRHWITEKTIRLMIPYVSISLIALVPKYFIENGGFDGFTLNYLTRVILIPRIGVWGHFWFLPVLLITYVLFGICKRSVSDKNRFIIMTLTGVLSLVLYFSSIDIMWLGFNDLKNTLIFFWLGIVFYLWTEKKENHISFYVRVLWLIVSVLVSIICFNYFFDIKVIMLFVAIIMISACWQFSKLVGKSEIAAWISQRNFTIYIFSWPFQAVGDLFCSRMNVTWQWMMIIMFILGVVGPLLIIFIYEKCQVFRKDSIKLILGIK